MGELTTTQRGEERKRGRHERATPVDDDFPPGGSGKFFARRGEAWGLKMPGPGAFDDAGP